MSVKRVRGGRPRSKLPDFEKAGSGIRDDGRWVPEFPGQRPLFPPGHVLPQTHGAYAAPVRFSEQTVEIADALRTYIPGYTPGMETSLQTYAITIVRVERAVRAIEHVEDVFERTGKLPRVTNRKKDPDDFLAHLRQDLARWITLSLKLADALGLTPSASARILKDAGQAAHAAAAHAELLERYRGAA